MGSTVSRAEDRRSRTRFRLGSGDGGVPKATLEELASLREENARLRLEKERPPSLGRAAERARSLAFQPDVPCPDAGDEALHALAEAMVMRETLLVVLQDFQTSISHLHDRLVDLLPNAEVERGRPARRRSKPAILSEPRAEAGPA